MDGLADFGVFADVGADDDQVRAEAERVGGGHGGADAEFAGRVVGGGDDAAGVGAAADGHGDVAQGGVVAHFNGCEEAVHVYVDDFAHSK